MKIRVALACLLLFSPTAFLDAQRPFVERSVLDPEDSDSTQLFGTTLLILDDEMLVGVPGTNDYSGTVARYLWNEDDEVWEFEEDLESSDSDTQQAFGTKIAHIEENLFITATWDSEAATYAGAVYHFAYDEDLETWVEEAKITPDDQDTRDYFGARIAWSSVWYVATAIGDDETGTDQGAAYVFEWDGNQVVEHTKLTPSDSTNGAEFGESVALRDDLLVVGAPDDGSVSDDFGGSVYLFRYDDVDDVWNEESRISRETDEGIRQFGNSVAISAEYVFVGAPEDTDEDSGVVFVYEFGDSDEWTEVQTLEAPEPEIAGVFGSALAASDELLVVGSYLADSLDGKVEDVGAAFLFGLSDGDWEHFQSIYPSREEAGQRFGLRLWLSNEQLNISADLHGDASQGALFTYELTDEEPFLRGDADGNGTISALLDALYLLNWSFNNGDEVPCMEAADVDGNDAISALLDSLRLLQWAFLDADPPPAPGTECGWDPVDDEVGCELAGNGCL